MGARRGTFRRAETVVRTPTTNDGPVPYTSAAVELVDGVHFTRTGRFIESWTAEGDIAVADGAPYSIRYVTNATWIVWNARQRGEADVVMPPTFECKRLDAIDRVQGDEV